MGEPSLREVPPLVRKPPGSYSNDSPNPERKTESKMVRKLLFAVVLLLVVAQVVPFPPADNPPLGEEVPAPPEVRTILRVSCYDCHSNETVWPWYSHVIPTKWFVRGHVMEGREHLNFSTWEEYTPERASRRLENVVEMVQDGKMPLPSYLRLHSSAALSPEDQSRIIEWARDLGRTIQETQGGVGDDGEPGGGADL